MIVHWLMAAGVGGVLLVGSGSQAASGQARSADRNPASAVLEAPAPLIDEIAFLGLRHIAPAALEAQMSSVAGARLDLKKIESDVKALGRLGWFDEIAVETQPAKDRLSPDDSVRERVRLVFRVAELPYLTKIEYAGSRLLSPAQIGKLLDDKALTPRLGEPADPSKLARIRNTIQSALAELGHPQPQVRIFRDESANGTVRVRYVIGDGPHIPVGRIEFEGHPEVSAGLLRHEMHQTAPGALFASWRGKAVYTREGFDEDRSRILIYYQDHGFPEARIGAVRVSTYAKPGSRWIPRPFRATGKRLAVSVPVEAGPSYTVESVGISPELIEESGKRGAKLLAYSKTEVGSAYSAKALEDLRHACVAAIHVKHKREKARGDRSVETSRTLDRESQLVRERIAFSDAP